MSTSSAGTSPLSTVLVPKTSCVGARALICSGPPLAGRSIPAAMVLLLHGRMQGCSGCTRAPSAALVLLSATPLKASGLSRERGGKTLSAAQASGNIPAGSVHPWLFAKCLGITGDRSWWGCSSCGAEPAHDQGGSISILPAPCAELEGESWE